MERKYIDLHIHLDGAITVEIAKELARIQGITLPARDDDELEGMLRVPDSCANLNEFLACFALPVSLMQTADGLRTAAYLVAENMRRQGVIYAEIRFAPQLHCTNGLTQKEVVYAVLDGVKGSGLKANIILCLMRGDGNEKENYETVEVAKELLVKDGGVVALDLAGAEALFVTEKYKSLFAHAVEYGIPFTIHAGEADGAESVKLALDYGAKRIGHGVRSFEDEDVMQMLIDGGIPLEMCPTSNKQTVTVADMTKYPFMDYLNQGIKVTLNTDDPAIEGTNIAMEYEYMEKAFGMTEAERAVVLDNAVYAAFTTDEVKAELRRQLRE